MAEFEDKLNSILSDPNSMAQIMQLAQSLSGGNNSSAQTPPPPPQQPYAQQNYPPQQQPYSYPPPQQTYAPPQQPYAYAPPPQQQAYPPPPWQGAPGFGGSSPPGGAPNPPTSWTNSLSSLLGSIDPAWIAKLMPLAQELGSSQNSNAKTLLYAMRPYLKQERQDKVERALQLARLLHIGKKFISNWEV